MTRNTFRALVMASIVGAVAVSFACSRGPFSPEPPTPEPGRQQAPAAEFMLAGTVFDEAGMVPLAGVEIEATSAAGITTTVSASDGTFSLPVVGEVELRAYRPGYRRAEMTLAVSGDTTVGVYLTRQRAGEAR